MDSEVHSDDLFSSKAPTPRTMKAIKICGLTPVDLHPIDLYKLKKQLNTQDDSLLKIHCDFHNETRKSYIEKVKRVRNHILNGKIDEDIKRFQEEVKIPGDSSNFDIEPNLEKENKLFEDVCKRKKREKNRIKKKNKLKKEEQELAEEKIKAKEERVEKLRAQSSDLRKSILDQKRIRSLLKTKKVKECQEIEKILNQRKSELIKLTNEERMQKFATLKNFNPKIQKSPTSNKEDESSSPKSIDPKSKTEKFADESNDQVDQKSDEDGEIEPAELLELQTKLFIQKLLKKDEVSKLRVDLIKEEKKQKKFELLKRDLEKQEKLKIHKNFEQAKRESLIDKINFKQTKAASVVSAKQMLKEKIKAESTKSFSRTGFTRKSGAIPAKEMRNTATDFRSARKKDTANLKMSYQNEFDKLLVNSQNIKQKPEIASKKSNENVNEKVKKPLKEKKHEEQDEIKEEVDEEFDFEEEDIPSEIV